MYVRKMQHQHSNKTLNDTRWNLVNNLNKSLRHSGRQAWRVHPALVCREDCAQPCNPKKHNP